MSKVYSTLSQMVRSEDLSKYGIRVAKWNDIARRARGGHNGPMTDLKLQMSFVEEEFDEMLSALRIGDRKEVIDGVCDLFVVASYAALIRYNGEIHSNWLHDMAYDSKTVSLAELELEITKPDRDYRELLRMVTRLIHRFDFHIDYNMNEVLTSNDSKYPTLVDLTVIHGNNGTTEMLEKESKDIETRSAGRYTGVHGVTVGVDNDTFVVFFDDKGKIMKPATFKEPKILA